MEPTRNIIAHHLQAFAARDLDGMLSDYAPDAVFFAPHGPLRGTDTIRPLFQALIAEFAKPGAMFRLQQQAVEGDYGYILWTAENRLRRTGCRLVSRTRSCIPLSASDERH